MTLQRSRQVHETLNGVNPSSSFRDMRSAKSGPNLWQIWQSFGPWARPYGANGQMTLPVHNYSHRQFHRTLNGENPSSGYRDMSSASLAGATIPLQSVVDKVLRNQGVHLTLILYRIYFQSAGIAEIINVYYYLWWFPEMKALCAFVVCLVIAHTNCWTNTPVDGDLRFQGSGLWFINFSRPTCTFMRNRVEMFYWVFTRVQPPYLPKPMRIAT